MQLFDLKHLIIFAPALITIQPVNNLVATVNKMQTFLDINDDSLKILMSRFGLNICTVENNSDIPGSHFGDCEAGLIDKNLYLRADTPHTFRITRSLSLHLHGPTTPRKSAY